MTALSSLEWDCLLKSEQCNQHHLFDLTCAQKTKTENAFHLIYEQLNAVEKNFEGGVVAYIQKAKKLLLDAKNDVNPYANYFPEKPFCIDLDPERLDEFMLYEDIGIQKMHQVAFVLVAGGMGERLGYPGTKVELPVDSITNMSHLEYFCRMIQVCQRKSKLPLPFVIMTSDDTHEPILDLLNAHQYFGLEKSQVHLLKQHKVPALISTEAHFSTFVNAKGQLSLEMKPHGHGDIHALLYHHKLTQQWVKDGLQYVFFFQDTNCLVAHALAPLLGVSEKHNFKMNSLTVPRKPGEALGAICRLKKRHSAKKPDLSCAASDTSSSAIDNLTINIEYNILKSLLLDSGFSDGDVADPKTGYSYFQGNTNILCFNLPFYHGILNKTKGVIDEFVNPKYADSKKEKFKSSARLECMMQDIPKSFDPTDEVGTTNLPRWLCFSTIKNNAAEAANKAKINLAPESPFTAEADFYHANAKLLEYASKLASKRTDVQIAPPVSATYLNVSYSMGPRVILTPEFGFTLRHISEKLRGNQIILNSNSTLILDGQIYLEGLKLDGALECRIPSTSQICLKSLSIRNEGVQFKTLEKDMNLPRGILIRGYYPQVNDITQICWGPN